MDLKQIGNKVTAPPLPHRRRISPEEQHYLAKLCTMAFNSDIGDNVVERLMSHINFIEKKMVGRMASHVEDLVVHYLMRYHASLASAPADAVHLEIGTLFGGTVLIAHHAVTMAEKSIPIHVIDPFEGYYGRGKDIITGEEISQDNFLKNLQNLGIAREDVVIHKGLSTDPAIIAECQGLKLRSLLIDGDHSYRGVKNDWTSFAHLVVPGGYVMIDNYNDFYWPEVMSYVNKELLPNTKGKWEVLLVYANSLLLRRTEVQDAEDASYSIRLCHELQMKDSICSNQKEQIETLQKAQQEKTESERELQAQSESLQAQLTAAASSLESLKREKDDFQGQAQLLQEELASLQSKYQAVNSEYQVQRKSTTETLGKLAIMQSMTEELRETHALAMQELQSAAEATRQEIVRLREESGHVTAQYVARAEELQAEVTRLLQEESRLTGELIAARTASAEHERQAAKRGAELEELRLKLERQEGSWRDEMAQLEGALAKAEQKSLLLQEQLEGTERVRQEEKVLVKELESLREAQAAEVAALQEDLAKRDSEQGELLAAYEQRLREAKLSQQAALAGLEQELRELRTHQEEELLRLHAEKREKEGGLAKLEQELRELRSRQEEELLRLHAEKREEAAAQGARLDKLNSTLQEATAEHCKHREDLEKRVTAAREELQAERQRMQREHEELVREHERESQRLDAAIAALEAELRQRDVEIGELQNSLSWKITSPLRSVGKGWAAKGDRA